MLFKPEIKAEIIAKYLQGVPLEKNEDVFFGVFIMPKNGWTYSYRIYRFAQMGDADEIVLKLTIKKEIKSLKTRKKIPKYEETEKRINFPVSTDEVIRELMNFCKHPIDKEKYIWDDEDFHVHLKSEAIFNLGFEYFEKRGAFL